MIGINIKLFLVIGSVFALSSIVFGSTKSATKTKTSSTKSDNDICTTKETCAKCIRTHDCIWCGETRNLSDPKLNSLPRCENKETVNLDGKDGSWCDNDKIVITESYMKIIEDLEFSSIDGKQVQVKPQRVKIRLRPGDEEKLTVKYRQAEDYPVDLYFLMDLSASMERYRDDLSNLGSSLAEALSQITSNFQLGFGSFVDKVVLPMTSEQALWTQGSCLLKNKKPCAPPYGYKNQMPLTPDKTQFRDQVKSAPISGNIDSPEGGLDALMQAMVCWKEIGWRDSARHLLVFSTDAKYHIAGDGRLAGIVEPNDERCHLNATNFYTHAELLDYPSLAQIRTIAKRTGIYIIFAVTKDVFGDYKLLSDYLPTASIDELHEDSKNVVKLVTDEYQKLINTVKMIHNTTNKIEVKTLTNCANPSENLMEKSECGNVRVNEVFEFHYTIKAIDCPENPDEWQKTITIQPEGVNETVTIEVELVCDCPCSRPEHKDYASNSTECTSNGDLTCGVCSCKKGYYGKQCLCTDDKKTANTFGACRASNTSNEECSGRGRCICDECKCNPRQDPGEHYYGKYCECDNFSCDRFDDMVCGGKDRGTCDCGVCKCNAGLTGKDCSCSSSIETCLPPVDKPVECNGFGECVCGKCKCDPSKGRTGDYCEICSTCPSQYCDQLKDCVECLVHKAGAIFDEDNSCGDCTAHIDLASVVTNLNETVYDEDNHVCTMPDATGCTFTFQYSDPIRGDTGNSRTVIAEKDKKCPLPPVSAFGVAGTAIGLTLFLGLLGLLAWKVLTMVHDHREYIKFEKERVRATYQGGTNPIFKEPTSTFKNPMFENQQTTKS